MTESTKQLTPRKRRLLRVLGIIAAIVFAVAWAGGYAYWHNERYKHFAVHEEGKVYRSAWLDADVIKELIHEYRLKTVLNLCGPGELGEQRWVDERRAVASAGAKLLEIHMPESVDPEDPKYQAYYDVLGNPANFPMLVHCSHGVMRTSKLLTIYDVLYRHESADESLKAMPLFGRDDQDPQVKALAHNLEAERSTIEAEIHARRAQERACTESGVQP